MARIAPTAERNVADAALDTDGFVHLSDELLMLEEREAARLFLDDGNVHRLGQLLWVLAFVNVVYALSFLAQGSSWRVAVAGVATVADLWLLRGRRAPWFRSEVRQIAGAVLLLHLLVLQLFHGDVGQLGAWFVLYPIAAARLRLSVAETSVLYGALYAVVALRMTGESLLRKAGLPLLELVLLLALAYLPMLALSLWLTIRRERRFAARWQAESSRHRDRLRMKQELEYAREIQLSMLPREAPKLPWLDVAALSLPATEVGGDYYDYFVLDPERVAVVVGDVTGHGVASGLVLSGVRSCLNLLQEELGRPRPVLGRVNTMLKRTSTPRMLMTLVLAVLDAAGRRLTVATAGHPPPLIVRAGGGEVLEVGHGAVPLGAMDGTEYREQTVQLGPGDVILLYSDGVVESFDPSGQLYGWQRLNAALAAAATDGSTAARVRDAILRNVWEFKGSTELNDDLTMVVIRCNFGP